MGNGPVIVERGGGGGTAIVAILVILILVVAGWYFLFGPGARPSGDTNINVNLPSVEVPQPT
jgi:cbb3-type cytochrome oxidase subunit 3